MNKNESLVLTPVSREQIKKSYQKIWDDDKLFRCSFEQLSKHFLKEILSINTFQVDFKILEETFRERFKINDSEEVPNDEYDFHFYICKTYLNLKKEPKETLLGAFEQVAKDLKEIDKRLLDIEKMINQISSKQNNEKKQEEIPILNYYKKRNQEAKDEILNFLKERIYTYSLNICLNYDWGIYKSFFLTISGNNPYPYSFNKKSYEVQEPNELENKFMNMPTSHFQTIYKQYIEDKPSFQKYLSKYIKDNKIINKIENLILINHSLSKRRAIIEEMIKSYQTGSKVIFANSVPTQIEGILHDLCVEFGNDENLLIKMGLQQKLDLLQYTLKEELFYEYYAFNFRIIRNRVAHGLVLQAEVDELADLLLLDLYDICQLTVSPKILINQKISSITSINQNLKEPDFKEVIKYLSFDKIEIPVFYNLYQQIDEIEKLFSCGEFWNFLEKEIEISIEPNKNIYMRNILISLKTRRHLVSNCTRLLKLIGSTKVDK